MNKYHTWNKKEITFMIKKYYAIGAAKCSRKLNLPIQCVITCAQRNKIKSNPKFKRSSTRLYHENKRKERDDKAKKLAITTSRQSYTLGFLWGDGHLATRDALLGRYYAKIEIAKKDYNNIGKIFECFGKWSKKTRYRHHYQPLTCATLFDNVLGAFLKLNDYDKKSTNSPSKILATIPPNLHRYFWKGFIDADGCFGWHKSGYFNITGNYQQSWCDFEKLMQELNIKYSLEKKSSKVGKISRISIYNKSGIKALGEYIYYNYRNIGLRRKHRKFLEIISKYRN